MIGKTLDNKYRIISELGEGMGPALYISPNIQEELEKNLRSKACLSHWVLTLISANGSVGKRRIRLSSTILILYRLLIISRRTDNYFWFMEYVDCQDLRKLIKGEESN